MATQSLDATLFASSHPDIIKRTNISVLIQAIALLLIGLLLFISMFELKDRSSVASMLLLVGGTAFMLLGVFRLFWKMKEAAYLPTGSSVKERSLFFDLKHLVEFTEILEQHKFANEAGFKCEGNGNLRMDIFASRDNQFVAVQLFQFVPYTYTPVTAIFYFTGTEAIEMANFLQRCKKA